jgi:hypothetical protein
VDVLYEVRDITGWTPENAEEWWMSLPEAGDHAWAARASRRRGQTRIRLAFIPSKFRLGTEPQPFAIELDLIRPPYTLTDITEHLTTAAVDAARERKEALQRQFDHATEALVVELQKFPFDAPMLRTAAEDFLMTHGLSRKIARNLIDQAYRDVKWTLRPIPGKKGNPIGISPAGGGHGGTNNQGISTPALIQEPSTPDFCRVHEDKAAKISGSEASINLLLQNH